VQDKTRRVVDERDEEHLLHGAARADGQIRPVLEVRVPQPVAMPLLEAPGGDARFGIHAHMARAVAPAGKPFLERAALHRSGFDASFPLQDLNELRDASGWHLPAQQNGLLQYVRRDGVV